MNNEEPTLPQDSKLQAELYDIMQKVAIVNTIEKALLKKMESKSVWHSNDVKALFREAALEYINNENPTPDA